MALQQDVEFRGITVPGAYIRVTTYAGGGGAFDADIEFKANRDSQYFDMDKIQNIPVDLNGPNPIKQAYEHMKTLPEFEGALDVFEE